MKLGWMATSCGRSVQFPGEIAGASLKRHPGETDERAGHVFPGEIAGASLKPVQRDRLPHRPAGEFPGEIAGASLKRDPAPLRRHELPRNSPAKSPGPH